MPRRAASGLLRQFSRELAALTARVLKATVGVSGATTDGGSSGSGFFIDGDGRILTNHHVVADVQPPISITLHGGTTARAGVIGVDKVADLALLKLDGVWRHHLPIRRTPARAGELCLAIGDPLGRYPETVTIGVVSGLARTAVAGPGRPHYHLLQTDCDIHEGNSGGPLVDVDGRVIGVTTLLDSESPHIGLAIPTSTIGEVLPELLARGQVDRATLGVGVVPRERTVEGKALTGLEVTRVNRQHGQKLQVGDFILRVARRRVPDLPSLFAILVGDRIGRSTSVELIRRGRRADVVVKPWRLEG